MFDNNWQEAEPGVQRRIKTSGERLMLVEVRFAPGAQGSLHSHPHEQITYVLEGCVRFNLDGEEYILSQGNSLLIPANVPHSAVALEESLLLDVFSPPREDFWYGN